MSKKVREYLRALSKAVAVYAAGAWVAVEVVDFAVQHYGLSTFLVDAAVIVAFGGGMMTAVVVWFHREPGGQPIQAAELVVLAGLATATAAGLFIVGTVDPLEEFRKPSAVKLIIETPTPRPNTPDMKWESGSTWGIGPPEKIVFDDRYYYASPGNADINMPGVRLSATDHPVLLEFLSSGNIRLTVVFVELPREFEAIVERGEEQSAAVVEATQFSSFSLRIDRIFRIRSEGKSVFISVPEPFFPEAPDG